MKSVWIEKTKQKGQPERLNGPRSVGRAIWSPVTATDGKNIYSNMLLVKQGDIVIHLIDDARISAISIVKGSHITECKGLPGTDWDEKTDCYLWSLHSSTNLPHVYDRKNFLNKDFTPLLLKISETTEVFYTKKLSLRQGAYLTPCSKELLTFLNREYKILSGRTLPHISNEIVYKDTISLEETIDNNFSAIKSANKHFLPKDSREETHNAGIKDLVNSFTKNLHYAEEEVFPFFGTGKGGGDIDLIIGSENTAIVIEYKTRSSNTQLKKEFENFYGKKEKHIKIIKENEKFKSKYTNFIFLFIAYRFNVSKLIKLNLSLKNEGYNLGGDTFIYHKSMLDEYFIMGKNIDSLYAKREFHKNINVIPKKESQLSIPAIQTNYKNMTLYTFTCSAKHLTEFATVSRKMLGDTGFSAYQRRLEGNRLKEIAKFLDNDGNFVNNIIIRFKPETIAFKKYKFSEPDSNFSTASDISIGLLTISPTFHSSFVIDGQHRLFSYLKSNKDSNISVSGLVDVNDLQEARYFVDINDKGKRVPQDLIWDLDGDIDPKSERGIISNAIKNLCQNDDQNNLFFENLKIPSLEQNGFSFFGLCNAVLRLRLIKETWMHLTDANTSIKNPIYNNDALKLTKNLFNELNLFYLSINQKLKRHLQYLPGDNIKDCLFNDTLIRTYLRIFKYYIIFNQTYGNNRKDEFFIKLTSIFNAYTDDTIKYIKANTGFGEVDIYERELVLDLKEKFDEKFGPDFKDEFGLKVKELIEEHVPNWVNDKIKERYPDNDWVKELFQSNDPKYKKMQKDSLQQGRPIHQMINWDEYRQIITSDNRSSYKKFDYYRKIFEDLLFNTKNGFSSFIDISNCWEQLQKYRSMTHAHGNKDGYTDPKRQKVKANYEQLTQLIENSN